MSIKNDSPLHIEWTPGWVQAVNTATGEKAAGTGFAALTALTSRHKQALVGVGRSQIFLKTARLPKAAPEDLRRILEVQIGQYFPLPANQLSFDFVQTSDQTTEGYLTIIAAMRAADLKQLRSELQQAGLTATRILPVSLGSAAVAAHAGGGDAIVVEGTPAGLAIDVVHGGNLRFSRLAPKDSDTLIETQRTLAAAGLSDLPMIMKGGGTDSLPPGARRGDRSALELLHEAVLFHFQLAEDRAREISQRVAGRTRLAGLMLLSSLLLVTLIWVDRNDKLVVIQKGEAKWSRELSKLRATRTSETDRAQKVGAIDSALTRAFHIAQPLSDQMAVLGDHLPSTCWLTGMTLERGKPTQLRGTAQNADDVSRYVEAIGATHRFRDVKLVFANSAKIEKTPVVQFNMTAFPIGNLSMPEPSKKVKKVTKKAADSSQGTGSASGTSTGGAQ